MKHVYQSTMSAKAKCLPKQDVHHAKRLLMQETCPSALASEEGSVPVEGMAAADADQVCNIHTALTLSSRANVRGFAPVCTVKARSKAQHIMLLT